MESGTRSSNVPGILKQAASRTFSFGSPVKSPPIVQTSGHLSDIPPVPPLPTHAQESTSGRTRTATASTANTIVPSAAKAEEGPQKVGSNLDLGGDFARTFDNAAAPALEKRSSFGNLIGDMLGRPLGSGRSPSGNGKATAPAPIKVDSTLKVEPSLFSWGSRRSTDQTTTSSPVQASPSSEDGPPQSSLLKPGKHASGSKTSSRSGSSATDSILKRTSAVFRRSATDRSDSSERGQTEDTKAIRESANTASMLLAGGSSAASGARSGHTASTAGDDDSLFDGSLENSKRLAQRYVARPPSPPRNRVMTGAQFEQYRADQERRESARIGTATSTSKASMAYDDDDDDDEPNYDDDDNDEVERSRQMAKQRRQQEAQMAAYRQQMMKVTGELSSSTAATGIFRPSFASASTPNLPSLAGTTSTAPALPPVAATSTPPAVAAAAAAAAPPPLPTTGNGGVSDGSDSDEEVPLAILAAQGFPKNRSPARGGGVSGAGVSGAGVGVGAGVGAGARGSRLSVVSSNPNLRASMLLGAPQQPRPLSIASDIPGAPGGVSSSRLPVFARNLPQDPYPLGNVSGPSGASALPPGGLIGVIANEERSRAMRRGISPSRDAANLNGGLLGQHQQQQQHFGTHPATQSGVSMDQMHQMQMQFMQMQMQFMQMMAATAGSGTPGLQAPRVNGHMAARSVGDLMNRHSMLGGGLPAMDNGAGSGYLNQPGTTGASFLDLPRGDAHIRTMSMVQPSSASWIQPSLPVPYANPGYAGSIRAQGMGYAPSIAPSERSNVGLPGRYRPVSSMAAAPAVPQLPKTMPPFLDQSRRASTMSGALGMPGDERPQIRKSVTQPLAAKKDEEEDDDDEEGWVAMKASRDKRRSAWRSKKEGSAIDSEIGAFIS